MKKIIALLLACLMVLALFCACGEKPEDEKPADEQGEQNPDENPDETPDENPDDVPEGDKPVVDINAKGEGVMTYADYIAAAVDSEVTIEAYVQQISYNAEYANANIFLQDADGAYYAYRLPLTAEEAATITVGSKLKIKGYKSEWAGEVEINCEKDASFELEEGNYVAEAKDVTELLAKDELVNDMNKFVTIKDAVVAASKDKDGNDAAFLYNWDGSGEDGSDLYFNVTVGEATYTFTVETDEIPAANEVYTTVKGLNIGDKVTVEAFLYWYEGAQPHVCGIEVTPAN